MKTVNLIFAVLAILCISCVQTPHAPNTLSEAEKAEGWQLLFDGESMDQWRNYLKDDLNGWVIEDGAMKALGLGSKKGGGDAMTVAEFENFELSLEWKLSEGGNSGIIYLIHEDTAYHQTYATGPEYQVIDDLGFPEELVEVHQTGANYDMQPPGEKELKPIGEWNTSRIKKDGPDVEHWLNGSKVLEYTLWTDEWKEMVDNCKWQGFPGYGQYKKGHISLQDHDHVIWFRNIKIREL